MVGTPGVLSGVLLEVRLSIPQWASVSVIWCSTEDGILSLGVHVKHRLYFVWKINQRRTLSIRIADVFTF